MQNIRELHRDAIKSIRSVVAKVRPADLDRPTPCAEWDVRALLGHMTGQDRGFAAAALADVSAEAFAPFEPSVEAHASGASAVVAAFAAADPRRSVLLPEFDGNRFPLETVIGFHLLDTVVHGWDVAASLGHRVDYADELLEAVRQVAELIPDGDFRTAPDAAFGPILATESTGWERTLALLGRDARWTSN